MPETDTSLRFSIQITLFSRAGHYAGSMKTEDRNSADPIQSFILRMWLEEQTGSEQWRISLTRIPSGKRLGFESIEAAINYLKSLTDTAQITIVSDPTCG